jgi:hypothetical protein
VVPEPPTVFSRRDALEGTRSVAVTALAVSGGALGLVPGNRVKTL